MPHLSVATLLLSFLFLLTACAADPASAAESAAEVTILFQGDSITDAGRSRDVAAIPSDTAALGGGYAGIAAASLIEAGGDHPPRIFNRGISGNKVFQLAGRWDADCIGLEPDIVSVLIGVNDIWHTKSNGYDGTVAIYERDYDALLARTREALPQVTLMVCEPFVLRCGAIDDSWFPEFDEYRAAARRVADKHGALFVPFQSAFDAALSENPPEHWAPDGVHPSRAGAELMAREWLRVYAGR